MREAARSMGLKKVPAKSSFWNSWVPFVFLLFLIFLGYLLDVADSIGSLFK